MLTVWRFKPAAAFCQVKNARKLFEKYLTAKRRQNDANWCRLHCFPVKKHELQRAGFGRKRLQEAKKVQLKSEKDICEIRVFFVYKIGKYLVLRRDNVSIVGNRQRSAM